MKTEQLALTNRGVELEMAVADAALEKFGVKINLMDKLAAHYGVELPPVKKGAKPVVPDALPIVGVVMRREPYNGLVRTRIELVGRDLATVETLVEATSGNNVGQLLTNTAFKVDENGQRIMLDEKGQRTTDPTIGLTQFEDRTPEQIKLAALLQPWHRRMQDLVESDDRAREHMLARSQAAASSGGGRRPLTPPAGSTTTLEEEEDPGIE